MFNSFFGFRGNGKFKCVSGYPQSIIDIEPTWLKISSFKCVLPSIPKLIRFGCCYNGNRNIDCFSVTETHLSALVFDDEIGIQGYTIYRLDQQAHTKGGGVAVYVRSCLSVERFLFDLEMKTRKQNRNKKRTEIERFDSFIERTQTRVAFGWLSERSSEKTSCPRSF